MFRCVHVDTIFSRALNTTPKKTVNRAEKMSIGLQCFLMDRMENRNIVQHPTDQKHENFELI